MKAFVAAAIGFVAIFVLGVDIVLGKTIEEFVHGSIGRRETKSLLLQVSAEVVQCESRQELTFPPELARVFGGA